MTDAEKLKKIREITGLTQTVFAKEIGFKGPSSISEIEKGRVPLSEMAMLAIEYRFGHLFQFMEKENGTQYVVPAPEKPPSLQDHGESELNSNKPVSLLNRKLNRLFELLPANIQMGVVSSLESYIYDIKDNEVQKEVKEAYDDLKKTYLQEALKKMG